KRERGSVNWFSKRNPPYWAVQWVIRKQELHHSFSCLLHHHCVCVNLHSRDNRHCTRSNWFCRLCNFNQAHSTIACTKGSQQISKLGGKQAKSRSYRESVESIINKVPAIESFSW